MSLHFLIDGYNVIKQLGFLKCKSSLEDARISLISIIQTRCFKRNYNNQVTVVFDGVIDFDTSLNQDKGPVKIIFSKGEPADEIIKKIVNDSSNPKQIVVITNDKAIKSFIESLGARSISVSEFFKEEKGDSDKGSIRQKSQKEKSSSELAKIELSFQQQEEINEELRRLWGK